MTNFNSEASVCFWIKIIDWNTKYATFFQAGLGGVAWNNYIFGFLRNNANSNCCFTISNGSSATNTNYLTPNLNLNEWYHIGLVYKTGYCSIYINGVLYQKYTTNIVPKFSDIKVISLGVANNLTGYQTKCKLNDVRIYDHALSPLEIKQISQGLILHYPLNNNGFGQENLLIDTLKDQNKTHTAYSIADYNFSEHLVEGEKYTITASITTSSEKTFVGFYHSGGSYSMSEWMKINKNGFYQKTFTATANMANRTQGIGYGFCRVYVSNNPSGMQGSYALAGTANVNWIKIEKGIKATPWCPNEADELYNKLGLNENIQYDTSGYCNNGIKIGTFQYKSDTPKYDTSTYAQGGASTHLEGIILPSEAKTVSLWIKCAKTVNSAIFNDRITGLQIGLLNSLLYVNSLTSTKGFTTTHWKNNEWNHVVVINDNGTRFCYVNGQAETQSGSSNYYIHNTDKFWLWNRSYNNNYPFKGSLSDLRIYCTALSLEDILLLYRNSAYIDNQGNIYGAIYEEV